jgi:hypothetical protein
MVKDSWFEMVTTGEVIEFSGGFQIFSDSTASAIQGSIS